MQRWTAFLLAAAMAACGEHDHDHGHDHGHDHDHDHADHDDHAHPPKYGGHLVEIGDHLFQVELLLDGGTLTAYVWDGHVENPVRLKMARFPVAVNGTTYELAPVADPLTGETVGDTSRFAVAAAGLKELAELEGTVGPLEIGGRTFEATAFRFKR